MLTFGQRLAQARKNKNMSQRELADIVGKTFSSIGKYERGEINASPELVKEFAKVLNVSPLYLLDDSGEADVLKNKGMVQRLKEIEKLAGNDQDYIIKALDAMLRDAKAKEAYNV